MPSPRDLPNPGIKPRSRITADSLPAELPGKSVCISIHSLHGIKCIFIYMYSAGFPSGSVVKNLPDIETDADSISGSERSPGGGNGNPL